MPQGPGAALSEKVFKTAAGQHRAHHPYPFFDTGGALIDA
jgi:hypothetical protein